jgi:hypothetical protein
MSVADIVLGYSAKHPPASAAADLSYRPISSLPLAAVRAIAYAIPLGIRRAIALAT